jgi:uncharacterized membrane protein HdeD (DUF308 family)
LASSQSLGRASRSAAFVLRFAVYAFLASGMEAMQAFGSGSAGPVVGRLLLALLDVAAGIVAIVWPGITALVLVPVVEAWAFVAGVFELSMAFQDGESAGERAFLGLAGLVSIALGIVLSIRPDIGALTLAQVYGLFSIVSGISILVLAANIGAVGRKPTSAAG